MRTFIVMAGALVLFVLAAQAEELSFDGPNAFRLHWDGLNTADLARFNYGRSLFHYHWDPLPAASGGQRSLGPLFNADSCETCHIRDGRGLPPGAAEGLGGLVLQIISDGPHPRYGLQVQDQAVAPAQPELQVETSWRIEAVPGQPSMGQILRRPEFSFTDPAAPEDQIELVVAPRMAPPMIGLGLLAAIADAALIAAADPEDANGDGISGQANVLADGQVGRFGWTASVSSVAAQVAHAATYDIGLTVPGIARPQGDCVPSQTECLAQAGAAQVGADFDMDENSFNLLAFYAANLAVPPRRITDPEATERGERLFASSGCVACHTPTHMLLSGADIAPYSDLLVHDMGARLADAAGGEWRTPPLWGIRRTAEVSGGAFFLHDGRARGLEEAILWHGGEASTAQVRFVQMSADQRRDLLSFLNSL